MHGAVRCKLSNIIYGQREHRSVCNECSCSVLEKCIQLKTVQGKNGKQVKKPKTNEKQ